MNEEQHDTLEEECGESLPPLSEEWLEEVERRLDELDRHPERTIPWHVVRDAAMARLRQT